MVIIITKRILRIMIRIIIIKDLLTVLLVYLKGDIYSKETIRSKIYDVSS